MGTGSVSREFSTPGRGVNHSSCLALRLNSRAVRVRLHLLPAFMDCSAVNFYLIFKTGCTLLLIYRDNIACYRCIDYLRQIICELKDHGPFTVFVLSNVCLRPLDCWDREFESRWGHVYSSLEFDECCVDNGLGEDLRSPTTSVGPILCDLETSTMSGSRPKLGCCATDK
jgi:hypothetical protein